MKMAVDTLCVHGDTPGAPAIAAAVRDALIGAGVKVRAAIIWP
ncbi:MAG TPA: LamB/YcsF family protein [Candidatus Limnocylindria bacterium]